MTRRNLLRTGFLSLTLAALGGFVASAHAADADHPVVVIDTSEGPITVELDRTKAPITVDNFLKYTNDKFHDGLVFHRVLKGFMIQGGGMTQSGNRLTEKGDLYPPIKNESRTGLKNARGAIAMARTSDLDSATSQFFINHVDNGFLDSGQYCAFGKVIDGMPVVDKIAEVDVRSRGGNEGVPTKPVTIKSIRVKK